MPPSCVATRQTERAQEELMACTVPQYALPGFGCYFRGSPTPSYRGHRVLIAVTLWQAPMLGSACTARQTGIEFAMNSAALLVLRSQMWISSFDEAQLGILVSTAAEL
jgi:hypothetical protein